MKILSGKTLKILHLTAIILFTVLLIVVYIVSAVWGEIAYTGGGLPIPDTGLTSPVLLFLVLSIVQIVAAAYNKSVFGIALAVVKCVVFLFALLLLCHFALEASYIHANADAGFYSNATFSACVIASLVIGALSFIAELAASILAKVREAKL